jgi:hypothetical protein
VQALNAHPPALDSPLPNQDQTDFYGRDRIRCVQQIGMLKLWERSKRGAVLPPVSAVHDEDLARFREKLLLLDVEWPDDEPRYLIRFQGSDIDRIHNRNCVGLYLNDVMEQSVRERGLKTYRRVVDQRTPAFNSTTVRDEHGATVNYERLLLPFTRAGEGVDQIYSIVTLFTEDNQSPFQTLKNAILQNEQP